MSNEGKIIAAAAVAGAAICTCAAQVINKRAAAINKKQPPTLSPRTRTKPTPVGSCRAPGCYNNHQDR